MLDSTMDELTQLRKRRLQMLIEAKPFHGNKSAYAERVGLSKGRITQLLDPDESFGERTGMKMAAALGLKDERYFERPMKGAAELVPQDAEPVTDVMQALTILAGALSMLDKPTRGGAASMLAMLATDPEQNEYTLAALGRLLSPTNLARIPQDTGSTGLTLRVPGTGGLNPDEQRDQVRAQKGKR